ncbi:MAG: NBR1-Ig-like domain-containing protein [Chloroflexi bacterium]|nr:NBR1-Ig-like domain-containing protein [Chloroflexota bacterium]
MAPVLTALALFVAACGSSPTATPRLPTAPATPPVGPTATPDQSPSPTSVPLSSPTGIAPTSVPTPAATSAPSSGACTNRYTFISDASVPDGSIIMAGQVFTKTWQVRNAGTCIWGEGYTISFVGGQAMTSLPSFAIPRTAAGATADLNVLMTAPSTPGIYEGFWVLKNPGGVALPPDLSVKIQVP